jgi:hypothetical protein
VIDSGSQSLGTSQVTNLTTRLFPLLEACYLSGDDVRLDWPVPPYLNAFFIIQDVFTF